MRYARDYSIRSANALKGPRRWPWVLGAGSILIVLLFLINPVLFLRRAFFQPVSALSDFMGLRKLSSTDGRTNLLILGVDRRHPQARGLTDTIILISLDDRSSDLALISLPRDVWVKPVSAKVNAVYALGGISLSKKIISQILGLPIHYYVVVDFEGFRRAVDAVSGITLTVDKGFEDLRYPLPGREDDDCGGNDPQYQCRFEKLQFNVGTQLMDGEMALKYARSRQSIGPEGSDFARDARQQKVIRAFIDKALSQETFLNLDKVRKLYETYVTSVETDFGPADAERVYKISRQLKELNFRVYVVDKDLKGNRLLYTPADFSDYGNQWVLLPKDGDFTEVRTFVQKVIFGS